MIYSSGEKLLEIVTSILDLAQINGGYEKEVKSPINLYEILQEIHNVLIKPIQANQIDFKIDYLPKYKDFIADGGKIQQIITNLVVNAVKFTHNGEVIIKVDCEEPIDNAVKCSVSVSDSGIGIQKEKLHLLFQRFSQVDGSMTRKYGGVGLGLAISQSFAELLGGEIRVTSEYGKGTTFVLTIPLTFYFKKAEIEVEIQGRDVLQLHDVKVLLVEDEPTNAKFCLHILKKMGCEIAIAENGQLALDMTVTKDYDIILMDCLMPVVDGFDVTRAIRKREKTTGKHVPILAMTAAAFKDDEKKCMDAGMDDYMSKPISKYFFESKMMQWAKRQE